MIGSLLYDKNGILQPLRIHLTVPVLQQSPFFLTTPVFPVNSTELPMSTSLRSFANSSRPSPASIMPSSSERISNSLLSKQFPSLPSMQSLQPLPSMQSLQPLPSMQSLQPLPSMQSLQPLPSMQSLQPLPSIQSLQPLPSMQSLQPNTSPTPSHRSIPTSSSSSQLSHQKESPINHDITNYPSDSIKSDLLRSTMKSSPSYSSMADLDINPSYSVPPPSFGNNHELLDRAASRQESLLSRLLDQTRASGQLEHYLAGPSPADLGLDDTPREMNRHPNGIPFSMGSADNMQGIESRSNSMFLNPASHGGSTVYLNGSNLFIDHRDVPTTGLEDLLHYGEHGEVYKDAPAV